MRNNIIDYWLKNLMTGTIDVVFKERISMDIANGVDMSNVPPEVIDRLYGSYLETLEKIKYEGFDDVFFK